MTCSKALITSFLFLLAGAGCSSGGSADAYLPLDEAGASDAAAAETGTGDVGTFPVDASDGGASEGGRCGDNVCQPTETCVTCPNDCGQCLACTGAPSCSQGLALPSQTQDRSFDELSAPIAQSDAGVADTSNCADAQLRLRIARLEVGHQGKEVWLPTGTLSGPAQS